MPSKEFLYLASSLFGVFAMQIPSFYFADILAHHALISMYTIFSCDTDTCMIYFEKCRYTLFIEETNFRNVSVDISSMSALFYGTGKGGDY